MPADPADPAASVTSTQVGADVVDLPGMTAVTDLASALAALDTIVTQGEGAGAESDESHYARFVAIRAEMQRLQARDGGFEPAWPAARNPLMRRPADASSGVHVDAPDAAAVLDLGNALYAPMLRLLTQAWGGASTAPADGQVTPGAALGAAMALMGVMAGAGRHLCSLPASAARPGTHAGLTFAVPRATEPLAAACARAWFDERLGELTGGMQRVAAAQPALATLLPRLAAVAGALRDG